MQMINLMSMGSIKLICGIVGLYARMLRCSHIESTCTQARSFKQCPRQ